GAYPTVMSLNTAQAAIAAAATARDRATRTLVDIESSTKGHDPTARSSRSVGSPRSEAALDLIQETSRRGGTCTRSQQLGCSFWRHTPAPESHVTHWRWSTFTVDSENHHRRRGRAGRSRSQRE